MLLYLNAFNSNGSMNTVKLPSFKMFNKAAFQIVTKVKTQKIPGCQIKDEALLKVPCTKEIAVDFVTVYIHLQNPKSTTWKGSCLHFGM